MSDFGKYRLYIIFSKVLYLRPACRNDEYIGCLKKPEHFFDKYFLSDRLPLRDCT